VIYYCVYFEVPNKNKRPAIFLTDLKQVYAHFYGMTLTWDYNE